MRLFVLVRSDFPNQVNNVLLFPFLFRGALDVGATEINEEMKLAASHAIARSYGRTGSIRNYYHHGGPSFGALIMSFQPV